MAIDWERDGREDPRDLWPYVNTVIDILFQAEHRFQDYVPFGDGPGFEQRFAEWVSQVPGKIERQALVKLMSHLVFVDDWQMSSLYRDAYRRVIVPWIIGLSPTPSELFNPNLEVRLRDALNECVICNITSSFDSDKFRKINSLQGVKNLVHLGVDTPILATILGVADTARGLIVLEDVVCTGSQVGAVLQKIRDITPAPVPMLFVPLLAMEPGIGNLMSQLQNSNVDIRAVLPIPQSCQLSKSAQNSEPATFSSVRSLVSKTAARVCEALPSEDPVPDEFGYNGTGAMLVTCHNAVDNTLPLIHHEAPNWKPLFKRLQHA